jgi:uncharacterized protein
MTIYEANGFEWDHGNSAKCQKHGVSIEEIESAFQATMSVFPDPAHSQQEERFYAIGVANTGRHVFIVFTLRERSGEIFIRPISARYMHQKEIDHYEKEIAKTS